MCSTKNIGKLEDRIQVVEEEKAQAEEARKQKEGQIAELTQKVEIGYASSLTASLVQRPSTS